MLKQYKTLTDTSFSNEENASKDLLEILSKTNFLNTSLLFPVDFMGNAIFSPSLLVANSIYPTNVWVSEREIIDMKMQVDVTAKPVVSATVGGKRVFWNYYYNLSDVKNMYSSTDAVLRTKLSRNDTIEILKEIVTDFEFDFEVNKKPTERISSEYRLFTDNFLYSINRDEIVRGTFHLLYHSCVTRKRTKVVYNSDLIEHFFSLILSTHFGMDLEINERLNTNEWIKVKPIEVINAYLTAWVFLEEVAFTSQIVSDSLCFEQGYVRTKPLSY